ncbi:gas vesicle protein [Dactylosporangium sp. NBC_01737]|uniref:gas vesicle protein GvpO n=1 Tax=Dactylosporangium sp. NBC_01737 TaxID=2975959 RepID=UPI002E0F9CEF|nr:gas vesicle protein [Dactylosporangium sp. NBC_01737]
MPAVRRARGAEGDRSYDDEAYERLHDRAREPLAPAHIARTAMRRVAELTGRQPDGVTSLEPADDGWAVEAEVVEDRRIPSSGDMLGLYRVGLRPDGSLVSLRRVRRYPRGRADGSEVT